MTQPEERENQSDRPRPHSAEDVRGAEIILRTRTRKYIFFGGLIALVALVFVLSVARLAGG